MEILRKIIDCKSLENSQGVSFIRVISLQFSDCNFAIKRIHRRFFLRNIPKTSCLKNKESLFFEKIVDQRLTTWLSQVVHNPEFYQKSWAHAKLFCRSSESSNIFTGKHPWWRLFFTEVADLEFIPVMSLKRTLSQSFF